ncbi:MAG: serine/threonine-protein kinase [Bythopirellula sp.]|nr:serine/threonine-protein kinase [Bythopirellula sp.]
MKIEKLGPYRIERQIGKGGMGAVYTATYEGSGGDAGMRVAIKALAPQLAMEEGFRERFEAEIESLKKLHHEGIVRLYGYGEQDGMLFYSMELVEGTSLEEEINKGRRFNFHETLQIGVQVCRALKHAHDHGIVHRDIKPANLLLTKDGRIKIADFGIARLFGGSQLTTAGGVLGTADYMSPEQADGRPVTEKCDQYSLGGVMYALLAGRPPFRAKSMPEMLQLQRFAEPEPVRRYAPETPEQLDRLIGQLLAKEPENRFPNVLVLGRHMEAMERALSRPANVAAEAAELEIDWPTAPAQPAATALMEHDATNAGGPQILLQSEAPAGGSIDLYQAPTIDQPEEPIVAASAVTPPKPATTPPRPAGTRFTTVDEEAQRHKRQEEHESQVALIARWVALVLLVGGLSWAGWKLLRPATADELFTKITTTIDSEGDADLRLIEAELMEFMKRFPEDSRATELTGYVDQLEFQRLQRQARTRSKVLGGKNLDPIEQLYLNALAVAETDPVKSQATLSDLIDLYDPLGVTVDGKVATGNDRSALTEENRKWLVLARQELKKLNDKLADDAKAQLPSVQERLAAAGVVARNRPAQAKLMYQAIIRLYGNEPWAGDAVAQARAALDELETVKE